MCVCLCVCFCWLGGRHEKGQLGLGTGISPDQSAMESVPTRVEFPEEEREGKKIKIEQLAAGYKHMMALAGTITQKDRGMYTCQTTQRHSCSTAEAITSVREAGLIFHHHLRFDFFFLTVCVCRGQQFAYFPCALSVQAFEQFCFRWRR